MNFFVQMHLMHMFQRHKKKQFVVLLIFIFHLFCVEHESARQEGKTEKNVKEVLDNDKKKHAIHANNHIYKINKRIQWNSDGWKNERRQRK